MSQSGDEYLKSRLAALQKLCRDNNVAFSFFDGIDVLESALGTAGIVSTQQVRLAPFRARRLGALAVASIGLDVANGPGAIATVQASLGAASTAGAVTVTVSKNGALVLTISFAQGASTATLAWASGSSFTVAAGDRVLTAITAAGTGAADLALSLDL